MITKPKLKPKLKLRLNPKLKLRSKSKLKLKSKSKLKLKSKSKLKIRLKSKLRLKFNPKLRTKLTLKERKFLRLRKLCSYLLGEAKFRKFRLKSGRVVKSNKIKKRKKWARRVRKFSSNYVQNLKKSIFARLISNVKYKFKAGRFFDPARNTIKIKYNRFLSHKTLNNYVSGSTANKNIKSMKPYRKKRRFKKVKKLRRHLFYYKFPRNLERENPLTRFYKSNIQLLEMNYHLLLGFHSAIGNSFKGWINPAMFSSILAIRNDMILFDLSSIFIRLKKGIQCLFQISKLRSCVLGFVDLNKNYRFSGVGFDHFLRTWLPGYLTNYRYVMKNLIILQKRKFTSLTRRQKKFFDGINMNRELSDKFYYRFWDVKKAYKKKGIPREPKDRKYRIPAVPQFGFCLEDHSIWLNECNIVGAYTMAVCDSESFPHRIDFPLIANQKSLPLNFLLVKLVSEAISCGKRMDYFSFIGFNYISKLI